MCAYIYIDEDLKFSCMEIGNKIIYVTLCNCFARHGLKQFRNGWADGPAYITQCPVQTGKSYVYNITVTGQRGTLWWHAHILWLRATVYGAIVIMPEKGTPFPFPQPYMETNIVLGQIRYTSA